MLESPTRREPAVCPFPPEWQRLSSPCRLQDFLGDVRARQAEHLARVFLFTGFMEERVWRRDAAQSRLLGGTIRQPFRNAATEAAKDAVFLDSRDDLEFCERLGQKLFIERFDC